MEQRMFYGNVQSAILLTLSSMITYGTSAGRAQLAPLVDVEISVKAPRITLKEPVVLTFEVTNGSEDPVQIDLGNDRKENFKISIIPPSGNEISLPQLRKSGFRRAGNVQIAPGGKYLQHIVLDEWFAFKDVGLYKIRIDLAKPALSNGQTTGAQNHFNLTLDMQPRNAAILEQRCEDLVTEILSAPSYEAAADQAKVLSYVRDPVAVPYLKKILVANKLVEPFAIGGLERIATADSVNALNSVLQSNDKNTAALARAALLRMESESSDPELKLEIRRGLNGPS
jgi:hypothetical protein